MMQCKMIYYFLSKIDLKLRPLEYRASFVLIKKAIRAEKTAYTLSFHSQQKIKGKMTMALRI